MGDQLRRQPLQQFVTDQERPRSRVPARGRCSLGKVNGLWRSLVAHLTGGQGVASSNLASPTQDFSYL